MLNYILISVKNKSINVTLTNSFNQSSMSNITVGAGDAFCGAFAAALDAGEPFSTALQWGCVAGSLACLKTGAQTALPSREEIAAHLLTLPA